MTRTVSLCMTAAAMAATLAVASGASAATSTSRAVAYALGNDGATLVALGAPTSAAAATGLAITDAGGASITLSAIAYRPETAQYYGYSDDNDTVYSLNVGTGKVAPITAGGATTSGAVGFDFNNMLDAARIVTTNEENRVFFPEGHPGRPSSPDIISVTDLFYVPGDTNEGVNPWVFANAYTNAIPFPTTTMQYVLDAKTDSLATLGNNAGTLTTIGKVAVDGTPLDFSTSGGLDILSFAEGDNHAFAILNTPTGTGLYALSLFPNAVTGFVDATFLRGYGGEFGFLSGLTVAPAPVPVPAAGLLLLTGVAGLGAMKRKRRAA